MRFDNELGMISFGERKKHMPLETSCKNYHVIVIDAMVGGVGQGRWCNIIS
jgi:hypothetical protein